MASRTSTLALLAAVALAVAAPAAAAPPPEAKALRKHSFPVSQGPLPAGEKAAWTHSPYEDGDCSICHAAPTPGSPARSR